MTKREFIMLLHEYANQDITGWMWSEKFNGMCAFWDGGITTGLLCSEVPFANTQKHGRYKIPPRATGLWSRYGQPIHCPPNWRSQLPPVPMHGELSMPGSTVQDVSKIVKKIDPDAIEWMWVQFKIFDLPRYEDFVEQGRIYVTTGKVTWEMFFTKDIADWVLDRAAKKGINTRDMAQFADIYQVMQDLDLENNVVKIVKQNTLPNNMVEADKAARQAMWDVCDRGGEGVVIRNPYGYWEPKRSHDVLKLKPNSAAEATVVGLTYGRATDKGSKLLGLMGALLVEWNDKTFKVAGFTEDERALIGLVDNDPTIEATSCPGEEASSSVEAKCFPRGSRIQFKYRELTNDGVPAEARYFR